MTVRCVVCEADSPRLKHRKRGVEILACRDCGLEFWRPPPEHRAEAVYDAAYFSDATADRGYDDYGGLEPVLRLNFARRLARIPRPEGRARLLDLGAAFGFAVDEARAAGWAAFGLEISREAAARAGAASAGRIAVGSVLRAPFASASFDAVTLWDVLEHLADPHLAMAEAARLLRPGGRLVLSTGDAGSLAARLSGARWHLYTIPEHLFFYSRESLRRLLRRHGFEVEEMHAETSYYDLGYLVERLGKTVLRRRTGAGRAWPGARIPVPLNLFDIVTARAVRSAPTA